MGFCRKRFVRRVWIRASGSTCAFVAVNHVIHSRKSILYNTWTLYRSQGHQSRRMFSSRPVTLPDGTGCLVGIRYPRVNDRFSRMLCGSRWLIWAWHRSSDSFWILAAPRTLFTFMGVCWVSPLLARLPSSLSRVSFMDSTHLLLSCWMLIARLSYEEDDEADFIWCLCIKVNNDYQVLELQVSSARVWNQITW